MPPFGPDFRKSFFQDNPGIAFQTRINQAGLSPNLTNFFRSRTSDFLKRFEGEFGNQLDRFGTTDLNPLDFFNNINLRQEFLRLAPQESQTNTRLNPVTRFLRSR